ncbi:B-4DMT family transporter [Amycolatopsis sp. FDAARGOS 1241]|uniref:B-4DMT family transporter n=1 Tax=Amycolatopsis sp. FDAARGOS 1241 TaxID=2778070 RepID=UPI0019523EC6|nr:B-4DMT family transporter [Amycolatopsis sp. FDAARGOS 1241]QRP43822.1 B-4DMT family transporter [Amycolatopsis sp. FDAARGOS 1241]
MLGAWLTRGLVMAVVHAAAMTLLAKWSVFHPTDQTVITSATLAVLVGVAALWSAVDGWRAVAHRGRAWFIAALVAGVVSGVLYVIGRAVFVDQTGVSELGAALTGGAAFSALLVLVPAGLGLFVGGRIRRPAPEAPEAEATDDDSDDGSGSQSGQLELPEPEPAAVATNPRPSPVSRPAANRARRRPTVAGRSPSPRPR